MARAVDARAEPPPRRGRAAVVVVSHQSRADLERCLPTVPAEDWDVTVVDNASTDGSADLVERSFPDVRLRRLAVNRGYGVAANVGIEACDGEYVLVMNADAWPLDDAIDRLAELADRRPDLAIVGPRLLWPDGSPQRSIFGYPRAGMSLAVWAAFPDSTSRAYVAWQRLRRRLGHATAFAGHVDPGVVDVAEPRFVSGSAMLLRRSALAEVGDFDESFFMYSEETDLCHRMRRAGWRVAVLRDAAFAHAGGSSTNRLPDQMYREQLLSYLRFFAKHDGLRRADRARRLLAAALFLRGALARGDVRRRSRKVARQLASTPTKELLDAREPLP